MPSALPVKRLLEYVYMQQGGEQPGDSPRRILSPREMQNRRDHVVSGRVIGLHTPVVTVVYIHDAARAIVDV